MTIRDYEEAIDEKSGFDIKEIRMRHRDVVWCIARLEEMVFLFDERGKAWFVLDHQDHDDYLVLIFRNDDTREIEKVSMCDKVATRMPQLDLKFNN